MFQKILKTERKKFKKLKIQKILKNHHHYHQSKLSSYLLFLIILTRSLVTFEFFLKCSRIFVPHYFCIYNKVCKSQLGMMMHCIRIVKKSIFLSRNVSRSEFYVRFWSNEPRFLSTMKAHCSCVHITCKICVFLLRSRFHNEQLSDSEPSLTPIITYENLKKSVNVLTNRKK